MECSEPSAIRDEELFAYLSGEKVRPAVVQHLARCQHCSAQLESYRRIELMLTSKLYRWDCPPNQILGEYQLGLLSQDVATAVKIHLSTCVLCAAEVATLMEFLTNDSMLVERPPVTQVSVHPSSLNNRHPVQEAKHAIDRLRDQSRAGNRRIAATLLPPQPQLAFRGQTTAWPRRYTAKDLSISIQVEQGASRRESLQLIGFVTHKGTALEALQGIPVLLSATADSVYTQSIDELGNFVFSSIAPATYTLELQFPESTIVIDQIPVTRQD